MEDWLMSNPEGQGMGVDPSPTTVLISPTVEKVEQICLQSPPI